MPNRSRIQRTAGTQRRRGAGLGAAVARTTPPQGIQSTSPAALRKGPKLASSRGTKTPVKAAGGATKRSSTVKVPSRGIGAGRGIGVRGASGIGSRGVTKAGGARARAGRKASRGAAPR